MGSEHMTVGELSSFLMYAFWVGISIAGEDKLLSIKHMPSVPHTTDKSQ